MVWWLEGILAIHMLSILRQHHILKPTISFFFFLYLFMSNTAVYVVESLGWKKLVPVLTYGRKTTNPSLTGVIFFSHQVKGLTQCVNSLNISKKHRKAWKFFPQVLNVHHHIHHRPVSRARAWGNFFLLLLPPAGWTEVRHPPQVTSGKTDKWCFSEQKWA